MNLERKISHSQVKLNVNLDENHKYITTVDDEKIKIYDRFISEKESLNLLSQFQDLEYETRNQYSDRTYINDEIFTQNILKKISVPSEIIDSKNKKWILSSINFHWRIVRCDEGYFMDPHLDGIYIDDINKKVSKYTIMIYIGEHKGGNIVFIDPKLKATYKTYNSRCIIFDQNLLHKSEEVLKGCKFFLRSEIMYKPEIEDNFNKDELEFIGIN